MKSIKVFIGFIVVIVLVVISVSYVVWLGYPKTRIDIFILDKTVPDFKYEKHKALIWVLNNAKIIKSDGKHYKLHYDYFGFHPQRPLSDYQYEIRRVPLEQIDSLSDLYEIAYFADTRGVYFNEWFKGFRQRDENSVIEGGLNQNEYLFLKSMKEKNKLIVGEYNILGSPTSDLISYKTELLFNIQSTGWSGCYFASLDSANPEIPFSIIQRYKREHNKSWLFKGEGIVLTNNQTVIVLENGKHLNTPILYLITNHEVFKNIYKLPEKVEFYNWFEIIRIMNDTLATDVATFQLNLTSEGEALISQYRLSAIFPAIVVDNPKTIKTCYFAGDFATISLPGFFKKLANSSIMLKKISNENQKKFFHTYYFPLMENLIKNANKKQN